MQHIVVPHFVKILTHLDSICPNTNSLAIWCFCCFAGVNIRWARARVLFYICAQFQFTIIHNMGFTLVKTHNSVNNEQYRLLRDFKFNILLRSVSEDLSLRLCFLTLKKQCIFEDGGVLEHLHL